MLVQMMSGMKDRIIARKLLSGPEALELMCVKAVGSGFGEEVQCAEQRCCSYRKGTQKR